MSDLQTNFTENFPATFLISRRQTNLPFKNSIITDTGTLRLRYSTVQQKDEGKKKTAAPRRFTWQIDGSDDDGDDGWIESTEQGHRIPRGTRIGNVPSM